MRLFLADTKALCANIKMLISDVDGVLTDGSIYKGANGEELKRFNVTDGAGSAIARVAGLKLALISGRHSEATSIRAAEMKIKEVYNGTLDKRGPYNEIKAKHGLSDNEIAYIGDDLIDLVIMEQVAVPIAVANCVSVGQRYRHSHNRTIRRRRRFQGSIGVDCYTTRSA